MKNTDMKLKTIAITGALTLGLVQNAVASSTMVTDAAGTQELWTFQEVLGSQKLISKINQSDSKGVTNTWDANGNMLSRTDAEGRVTTYTYNGTNQRLSMTEANGTPEARTTSYEYVNADIDLVTKTISPSIYSTNSKEVVNSYDANQNITAVTINGFNAIGGAVTRSTTFAHDVYGKVTQINGPRTGVNDITLLEYYDCNTGAECGQLKKVTNAAGHINTYDSYDAAARLLQSTDANGVITTYSYHPRGWLLSMTQTPTVGAARVTTYEYDNVGQLTKTTLPDGTEQNYVYDAAHDLREISDNLGNKVTYQYDAKGNRTQELVFDPDVTLVRSTITTYDMRNFIASINNGGSVTQLLNDAVGNLDQQTDPNLNPSTDNSFDPLDRLTNTLDSLANNSGYQYNVTDQLTQVTAPNGAVTAYEYDDLGNQTKEISADRGTTIYTYDDAGNVLSMTDARGITTVYAYDALNRRTGVTFPTATENIIYTYDVGCDYAVGRFCQVQDDSGVHRLDYDAWGNVARYEKEERDSIENVIGTYVTSYQYDNANRITQTTYPSGRSVATTRDVIGRLTGLSTISSTGETTQLISGRTYRADGLWTQQTYGNGLVQSKTYDLQGRLSDDSASNYSRQYTYDANGNITKAAAIDNAFDTDYDYDVLDRLTQESDVIRSMVRGFGYDANGNREQATLDAQSSILTYTASSNRLDNVDGSNITLDPSGRMLSDNVGHTYAYNDAGRLSQVSVNTVVVGQYTYNNQQLRTQKVANNISTVYHYDFSGNLIAESVGSNTSKEYIYADGEVVSVIIPDPPGGLTTEIISPAPGATFPFRATRFTWSEIGAEKYQLLIGSTPGASDIRLVVENPGGPQLPGGQSPFYEIVGDTVRANVLNLPASGDDLYVTVNSQHGGVWHQGDSVVFSNYLVEHAKLLSPVAGSSIEGTSATFTWSSAGPNAYYLVSVGTIDINSGLYTEVFSNTIQSQELTVSNLPADGSTVQFALRTFNALFGIWQTSVDLVYEFTNGPEPLSATVTPTSVLIPLARLCQPTADPTGGRRDNQTSLCQYDQSLSTHTFESAQGGQ